MSPVALRREIGRLLIAGFTGLQIPVELRALARDFGLGGIILFARNIAEPGQVSELCFDASRLTPEMPAWVSVDQEGERFARVLAAELRAVGITLDYAPVLDVHTNAKNPIIGDRALAEKAADAARLGAAIVRALQNGQIAACGKHFPGHGDTHTDSHLELPIVEHPPERLREVEFLPFKAAIEAQVATMMTAHVLVPALDEERPATLSKRIVTGILRHELHYEGVILSDDLEMKALANDYPVPESAVLAIAAGCDGVLVCSGDYETQAASLEALIHAVEQERIPLSRIEDALKRQQQAKERFLGTAVAPRPLGDKALRQVLGREEHRAVADEMARFA
jgi:beta-N-acetylhexosaminidase